MLNGDHKPGKAKEMSKDWQDSWKPDPPRYTLSPAVREIDWDSFDAQNRVEEAVRNHDEHRRSENERRADEQIARNAQRRRNRTRWGEMAKFAISEGKFSLAVSQLSQGMVEWPDEHKE